MKRAHHQPACMPAHDLLNKLSVIVGCCDLLNEMKEQGNEYKRRLGKILDAATHASFQPFADRRMTRPRAGVSATLNARASHFRRCVPEPFFSEA
jgi:hypothetical protein